jgi:hypothetical protein
MYEFPNFVYLDVEKTGSSFIFQLLTRFCVDEGIRRDHHEPMPADCDRSKFYFISVRDPLDTYISLYSFGCESRGKMRMRFEREDLEHVYDGTTTGFHEWLKYALRARRADVVATEYATTSIAQLLGPQSYRYLCLAIPGSRERLGECATRDEIRALHDAEKLPSFTIRHENFAADLTKLLRGPLNRWIDDVDGAVRFVETGRLVNASKRIDESNEDFAVKPRLMQRLREREWFLYELFNY